MLIQWARQRPISTDRVSSIKTNYKNIEIIKEHKILIENLMEKEPLIRSRLRWKVVMELIYNSEVSCSGMYFINELTCEAVIML